MTDYITNTVPTKEQDNSPRQSDKHGDLDDYIFRDENIKTISER